MADRRVPFSSQWYAAGAPRRVVRRVGVEIDRSAQEILSRLPDRSMLTIAALLLLALGSAWMSDPSTDVPVHAPVVTEADRAPAMVPTLPPSYIEISTRSIGISVGSENGPLGSGHHPIVLPSAANAATPSVLPGAIVFAPTILSAIIRLHPGKPWRWRNPC